MNCSSCGNEIKETFLGKLKGTIVKVNEDGKNKNVYFCNECQRKKIQKTEKSEK